MTVTEAVPTTGTPITNIADVPVGTELVYIGQRGEYHDYLVRWRAAGERLFRGVDEGRSFRLQHGGDAYNPGAGHSQDRAGDYWFLSGDSIGRFAIATPAPPWRIDNQPAGAMVRYNGLPEDCRGVWEIIRASAAEVTANMVTADDGRTGALPTHYGFWPNRGGRANFRMEEFAPVGGNVVDDENDEGSGSVAITTDNVLSIPPRTRLVYTGNDPTWIGYRAEYTHFWMGRHDTDGTSVVAWAETCPVQEDGYLEDDFPSTQWEWVNNTTDGDTSEEEPNLTVHFQLAEPLVTEPVVLADHATKEFGDPEVTVHQYLRDPEDAEVELAYALNDAVQARAEVATIRSDRDVARRDLVTFKQRVFDHVVETAVEKDWCVEGTNRHLEACGLPEWDGPERDYEVTVTCRYTTTVTVTARDEDSASEMVSDDIDSYVPPPAYERWDDVDVEEVTDSDY